MSHNHQHFKYTMRKQIISSVEQDSRFAGPWLDLERLAEVELTSEDVAHPIESALIPGGGVGWRASQPGKQIIRLVFDEPQRIARVRLVFREADVRRTQEFVLRWSADRG